MQGAPARKAWRALFLLLFIVTCSFAFTPAPPREVDTGWDKLNHALAFASLAFSAAFAFVTRTRQHVKVVLGLLAFGIVIELVQSQIPGRDADAMDVAADAVGIACGLLLAWLAGLARLAQRRH